MEIARVNNINSAYNVQRQDLHSAISQIAGDAKSEMQNKVRKAIEEASSPNYYKERLEKDKLNTLAHKIADIAVNEYKNFSANSNTAAAKNTSSSKYKQYFNSVADLLKGRKVDISL